MSATLTHPEAHATDSDQHHVPAPRGTIRWIFVAATAVAAVAVIIGIATTGSPIDDGSHQFAETQRQTGLAPVDTPDGSSETAELQRQLALAGQVDVSSQYAETQRMHGLSTPGDGSSQFAETQRMAALAIAEDSSSQFAETQRQLAIGSAPAVDNSHDASEFERMQTLAPDDSWDRAETRRFAALNPRSN